MVYNSKDLQTKVAKIRKKGYYKPKKKRRIDWSAYTLNQINDLKDTLNFIRDEVDKVYVRRTTHKVGRPSVDPGNLAKAILFAEFNSLPERKAQGWIDLLGHQMGIDENIDDWVIGNGYRRFDVIRILDRVFENVKKSDGCNGGDGSGLEKSRKENYESTKKKNLYMVSIVDSREVVQAFNVGEKQECKIMRFLVDYLRKSTKKLAGKLTLDAGFVDRKLTQMIKEAGLEPYIFPKKNTKLRSKGSPAWNKMWLNLIKKTQEWLEEYHVRSHTESFHSSFKRIFGIVTKQSYKSTYTQVLSRIIHNNRRKLSYHFMAVS